MRLLIVEDEKELSRALTVILQHNQYQVDLAYDGIEAMEYLDREAYDGVILDIMLPKMDGLTVLRTIRQKGNMVPVIILTAKSEVDDKVLGLDSGANDYLTKPFAAKELLARIRVMTRSKEQEERVFRYGNMILNRDTFELSSPYEKVRLTNKEYQVMEYLIKSPRHIVSTERLMEQIWGYESESELHAVWVCLSNLRKKLGALKATVQIRAYRNQGYALEEIE